MNKKIKNILNEIVLNDRFLKIIIFRTDRIGDVVLSIGIAEILKKYFEKLNIKTYITFVVKGYTKPILENNPFIDDIFVIDNLDNKNIAEYIKGYDVSISLFASENAVYPPFYAKIPIRIGPFSKIRSFLFNFRMSQHRSESIKNEAEYNIDLIKKFFDIEDLIAYPKIFLKDEEKYFAREFLIKLGIEYNDKFIIIHPGSGGSSKDFPLESYFRVANVLAKREVKFLISGNEKELNFYKKEFLGNNNYKNLSEKHFFEKELNLREFFSIMNYSKIFISNSTGPLHCASALDVKTISFYPKLKTCSSTRWGVFNSKKWNHFVFSPVVMPCDKCETSCGFYPCMKSIDVKDVIDKVFEFLNQNL
jgi:ADP-heptose:LPS heptosyltransferase